jgi:hypothetical protein
MTGCRKNNDTPTDDDDNEVQNQIAVVAEALGEKENYSHFVQSLASLDISDAEGPFTVLAVTDSIIEREYGTETKTKAVRFAVPPSDLMWHIIKGKYSLSDLAKMPTLQTIDGQTLNVHYDRIEISDGVFEDVYYINDQPLEYREFIKTVEGNIVYPIGKILPKTAVVPSEDNELEYLEYIGRMIEGKWLVRSVTTQHFLSYSIYGEISVVENGNPIIDQSHVNCVIHFEWEPQWKNSSKEEKIFGPYKETHVCGADYLLPKHNLRYWTIIQSRSGLYIHWVPWAGGFLGGGTEFPVEKENTWHQIAITQKWSHDYLDMTDDPVFLDAEGSETKILLQKIHNR